MTKDDMTEENINNELQEVVKNKTRILQDTIDQGKSVWVQFNSDELSELPKEIRDKTPTSKDGLKDYVFKKLQIERKTRQRESMKSVLDEFGIKSKEELIEILKKKNIK